MRFSVTCLRFHGVCLRGTGRGGLAPDLRPTLTDSVAPDTCEVRTFLLNSLNQFVTSPANPSLPPGVIAVILVKRITM